MSETQPQASDATKAPTGPGVVASGWLAADSSFGETGRTRLGAGLGASLVLHGVILAIILAVFALTPSDAFDRLPDQFVNLVFMQVPGPGGGGGGSPEAAPPKPVEIPKPKAPEPIPVEVPTPPPVPPPPQLNAPVITPNASVLQASGMSSVSLARQGGGGQGRGLGQGRGSGLGEGQGGGTGGGIFNLGAGINNPQVLHEERPTYTPEAMRAKIQGQVRLQVVILESGRVGDVKILKSLDPTGLDQEAIKAAKRWIFRPATKDGRPVPVYAELELDFRIF